MGVFGAALITLKVQNCLQLLQDRSQFYLTEKEWLKQYRFNFVLYCRKCPSPHPFLPKNKTGSKLQNHPLSCLEASLNALFVFLVVL